MCWYEDGIIDLTGVRIRPWWIKHEHDLYGLECLRELPEKIWGFPWQGNLLLATCRYNYSDHAEDDGVWAAPKVNRKKYGPWFKKRIGRKWYIIDVGEIVPPESESENPTRVGKVYRVRWKWTKGNVFY